MASQLFLEKLQGTLMPRLSALTAPIFKDCAWHVHQVPPEFRPYVAADFYAMLYQADGSVARVPAEAYARLADVFDRLGLPTVWHEGDDQVVAPREPNYLTHLPSAENGFIVGPIISRPHQDIFFDQKACEKIQNCLR